MLMGHALIFGAAGATVKLFSSEQSEGACFFFFIFFRGDGKRGRRGENESRGLRLMTCALAFRV